METELINEIVSYTKTTHDAHSEGCKLACQYINVAYRYDIWNNEGLWVCAFGGCCIGTLHRNEAVVADSLIELKQAVIKRIKEGLAKEQEEGYSNEELIERVEEALKNKDNYKK